MKDTVIIGVCATGRVVRDCLTAPGGTNGLAGFIDGREEGAPSVEEFDGLPVLGTFADLARLRDKMGIRRAIVGIGEIATREALCGKARALGIELLSAVHPSAVVARGVHLGENVILAPGAVAGVGAVLKDGALLNTACSVDHDCAIGEFAHICPGAHLAGSVKVGRRAWVGIGSAVTQGVSIGEDTFIGAGSVVVKDLDSGVLAYGAPARVIRQLTDDERGRIIR